jgi:hypothetical protein
MRFFKLLQSFEHFSKATVIDYRDSIKYNFKTFNELTDYVTTDKLKKVIDALKLEKRTDIKSQKMYEALKRLFPEQDTSIKLGFVD